MREGRIGKLLSFITLKQSITRWSSTIRAAPPFLSPNAALRVRQPQEKIAGEVLADGLIREKVAGRGSADRLKQEKVAGRGSADGLKQEKVAGRGSADGLKRKTHPEKRISGVGFRLNMLRKWLSWRLDCEILHFFIIFAAEKIKPI